MPSQTARDAILTALQEEHDAHPWIVQTPPVVASIALAALGIPADATADDVRAGMARMRWNMGMLTHRKDGSWEAWTSTFDGYGQGDTPVAAVLALDAKLKQDNA